MDYRARFSGEHRLPGWQRRCRQLQLRPGESVQWRTGSLCSPECAVRDGGNSDHSLSVAVATYAAKARSLITSHRSRSPYSCQGRGCGVGRSLRGGMGRGVGVGRIVAVGVAVGLGVAEGVGVCVGVGVAVAVALAVGVGVGAPKIGAATSTVTGEPVLKKSMVAVLGPGAPVESNRKLYNVAHLIALAFGLVAKVSVLHVITSNTLVSTSHGVLLNPASPTVPSCAQPGCCGGA